MRKIISTLLVLLIVLTALPGEAVAEEAESGNLEKVNTYSGQFADVASKDWYAQYVQLVYEYGLMGGVSETSFAPNSNLSVAEALAIACRLHSLYAGSEMSFPTENPWYQPYVDYAHKNKILPDGIAYTFENPVTRADFALFIKNALPDNALPAINEFYFPDIPDVYSGSTMVEVISVLRGEGVLEFDDAFEAYYLQTIGEKRLGITENADAMNKFEAIYSLYDAGVLTGNDQYGTFTPNANITRSAVATIISRVVEPSLRQHISLTPKPKDLVTMDQLANLSSLQRKTSRDEFVQAYEAAKEIVEPFANLDLATQVCGVTIAVQKIYAEKVEYSMTEAHYSDPYGFFILNVASCAGCTRALGLCLNMLGIPYEHINENGYTHQWARVNVNGTYWVCDAQDLYFGPEKVPYEYPD